VCDGELARTPTIMTLGPICSASLVRSTIIRAFGRDAPRLTLAQVAERTGPSWINADELSC
jgi:hypothetical protein